MMDTAGQYHSFIDMCGYCQMSTGGQHETHCSLFQNQNLRRLEMIDKIEQTYTLHCDNCGKPYQSPEGFPIPQLCSECSDIPIEQTIANPATKAPKPESGLLTQSKIDFEGIIACACDDYRIIEKRKKDLIVAVHRLWGKHLRGLVNDEIALTASIVNAKATAYYADMMKMAIDRLRKQKDAEAQTRVERIIERLDACFNLAPEDDSYFRILVKDVLNFLKTGKTSKELADERFEEFKKQEGVK